MTTKAATAIQPYLFFNGRCEEALEFYRTHLNAEVSEMMRFKDSPDPNACNQGKPDNVMHSSLRIGDSVLMASDGCGDGTTNFQGFGLSYTVSDEKETDRIFGALADGGSVQMPLAQTFFSPRFGMVTDRFGILWMIYMAQ